MAHRSNSYYLYINSRTVDFVRPLTGSFSNKTPACVVFTVEKVRRSVYCVLSLQSHHRKWVKNMHLFEET